MRPTAEVRGSLPAIVRNDLGLYEGDLKHYFRAVFFGAKNLTNPYHNFRHLCHVLWLCHDACLFYANELTKREMRELLIAALFHDFDHTGKTGPDSANIEKALKGLRRCVQDKDLESLIRIGEIICATEYPYTVASENLDLSCQIIRDADLSQALSVAWIQQVVFGLASEWGRQPMDVLKTQDAFHGSLRLRTEWASTKFPQSVINEKLAEARELRDLLEPEPGPAEVS